MLSDLRARLRSLFRRSTVERELDDELQFHRQSQIEAYARQGLSPEEARRRLGLEFGGLDQMKDQCRDARGISILDHLLRDTRYGLRTLRKTPSFSVVAALTLALGIGVNTAIFSVVYGVLLRPLPFADPSALIVMHETTPRVGAVSVSYPNFLDWRTGSRSFSAMAAVCDLDVNLGGVSQPEAIQIQAVSSNYLSMLGVRPLLGRDFTPDEDRAGAERVVLLSYALWQSHFAADRGVINRTISLDGRPAAIIGVLPRDFRTTDPVDLVEPIGTWLTQNDSAASRGSRGDMVVVGRLNPGVSVNQARAEMEGLAARLARLYPEVNEQFGVLLQPLRDVLVGDVRPALTVLAAAVVAVLLIACANVASLSLIRGAGRAREIALRMAIGASRGRIVAQLLVESAILATLGGVAGIAIARGGLWALASLLPMGVVGDLNGTVLAFAGAAVVVSTIVTGVAPAMRAARGDVAIDLNEGGRGASPSRRQQRWRAVLVVAEVSLALVLLVGAGLMMRSLSRLLAVDPGVQTDRVLTVQLGLRSQRYEQAEAKRAFWDGLLDRVGRIPGVEAAALGSNVPLLDDHWRTDIWIDGLDFPAGAPPHPDIHVISAGYTRALGIRLLQGRTFTDSDTQQSPLVGLINRSVADRLFGGAVPVGRRFAFRRPKPGTTPVWITIVGVLDDTRLYGLDNPSRLEIYLPRTQRVLEGMTLIVKSTGDPSALVPAIRAQVSSIDPDQPLSNVATMDDLRDASISTRLATFFVLGLFSVLALTLAAIGIYGVMSYSVAQRTNEMGIRLALGAQPSALLVSILRQGLVMAGLGIAIGLAVAFGATRLMDTLLFGVSTLDPLTFAAVAATLLLTALVACAAPGWRALRMSAVAALRHQ